MAMSLLVSVEFQPFACCSTVLISLDYIETAVAFDVFKDAGFEVHFATETGNPPKCDDRMLYGVTGKILVSILLY
jgi:ThiJ/PfpI family protein